MQHPLFLVWLCIAVLCCIAAGASGWNDYKFDIDDHYMVLRANAFDVHIWRKDPDGGIDPVTRNGITGPLYEISIGPRYAFAKNWAISTGRGYPDKDISRTYYTIINLASQTVYGPFSQEAFADKLDELGLNSTVKWQSLREAHRTAMRDGRADPHQPDTALVGQLFFLSIWLSPFLLAGSVALTVFLYHFLARHIHSKLGRVLTVVGLWPVACLMLFLLFSSFFVFRWAYMRFL
jgi:hypothetical protein